MTKSDRMGQGIEMRWLRPQSLALNNLLEVARREFSPQCSITAGIGPIASPIHRYPDNGRHRGCCGS
jgi:hypothetical protein